MKKDKMGVSIKDSIRAVFEEWITVFRDGIDAINAERMQRLSKASETAAEVRRGFMEYLGREDIESRWPIALAVLYSRRAWPEVVDQAVLRFAERVLIDHLERLEDINTLKICEYLRMVDITDPIEAALRKIVQNEKADYVLGLSAAVALAILPPGVGHNRLVNILRVNLSDDREDVQAVAAIGLIRLGDHESKAMAKVMQLFPQLPMQVQTAILKSISDSGKNPTGFKELVVETLLNSRAKPIVRYFAAKATPVAIPNHEEAVEVFLTLLERTHAEFEAFVGAVDALRTINELSTVVGLLMKRRSHPQDRVRRAAARGLALATPVEDSYANEIVGWLQQENDTETCEYLCGCLTRSGPACVEALASAVEHESSMIRLELMARVLGQVGDLGISALGQLLVSGGSERVIRVVASALMNLGPRAMHVLPEICAMVEECPDSDLKLAGIICLLGMGPDATDSIPTLIRVIARAENEQDVLAHWAFLGLLIQKNHAIKFITNSIPGCSPTDLEFLQGLLRQLLGSYDPRFAYLDRINADTLLDHFTIVVTELKRLRKPSIRGAVGALNNSNIRQPFGNKQWDEHTMLRDIANLEKILKNEADVFGVDSKLLEIVKRQGVRLTTIGEKVFSDASAYLDFRRAQRGETS